MGAADFNGDGAADLAVANAFNRTVSVLQNKTASGPVPNCIGMAIVSGKRSAPIQSGAPGAVRFQTVRLGQKGSIRVFRATNAGSRILKLGALKRSRGFKLLGRLPKKLAPGKSAIFKVQFIGNRPGTWSGRIKLATSDPLRNPIVTAVVGRCIAPRRSRH